MDRCGIKNENTKTQKMNETNTQAYAPKREKLTKTQIAEVVGSGIPVMIGEFRGFAVAPVEYDDKTTGKKMRFIKCTMNVEQASGVAVTVEHRLPKGFDNLQGVNLGLTRGQRVLLRLAGFGQQKGQIVASVGSEPESVAIVE